MAEEFSFRQVCGCEDPNVDVIFIHGLNGGPEETWKCADNDNFWPEWLAADLPSVAIYTLGYPNGLFEKWAKKEMDIYDRATNVLEYMSAKGIGSNPCVFITHSLGGILAKQIIRKAQDSKDEDWGKICDALKLVVFLSTPHRGASLASIIKFIAPKISSSHITALQSNNGPLKDINAFYKDHADSSSSLRTVVYFEKYKTCKVALVVDANSADPGVSGATPIPVDKDHIGICKPADKDDLVYMGIRRHLGKVVTAVTNGGSSFSSDYEKKHPDDRRDLLSKLIDANRGHEYSKANEYQNKFARSYIKLGLYTSAKDDHDALLSKVEQRFVTHIYHALICKDASEEAILNAIQDKVIQPIESQMIGNSKFNEKEILSALYYLTEQCHIRWDAEK